MKRLPNRLLSGTLTFVALLLVLGAAGRAYAQATPTSPVDVVTALAAAQNANDPAAMRALIAPNAGFVTPTNVGGPLVQTREEFITNNTGAHNSHVAVSNLQQTASDTVSADAVLTGGDIPALPHPFMIHVTFTVAGGLITHAIIELSPQTAQDLSVLGTPGMPTTGAGANTPPLGVLGLLGLLCLLTGALARRAYYHGGAR